MQALQLYSTTVMYLLKLALTGLTVTDALEALLQSDNYQDLFVATLQELSQPCYTGAATAQHSQPAPTAVDDLLAEFQDVFVPLPDGVPARSVQHSVAEQPDSKSAHRRAYRMSPLELQEVEKQLAALLSKGHIRPFSSDYATGILFARKKSGELRMCVDYRALIKQTIKDRFPLPRAVEIPEQLRGATHFSNLDLASGYHQIPIAPADVHKTAFRTKYGQYGFTVMPFGLCNAPATFQRAMNNIFSPHLDRFVGIYLDDIIVYSSSLQEHKPAPACCAQHPARAQALCQAVEVQLRSAAPRLPRSDHRSRGHPQGPG